MRSIRTKTTLLTVCAIVVAMTIATLLSVSAIRNIGNSSSDQMLYLLCETGEKNLDSYFESVEQSVELVSSFVKEDLEGLEPERLQAIAPIEACISAPLIVQNRLIGTVKLYYTKHKNIDETTQATAIGFAELLSTQLALSELDAKTEQAQGALSGAQAVQTKAEKGARVEDVASLRAVWQAAVAAADLAGKTYERTNNLYREGVVPAQRRDEALAARDASARNAEASRQQYEKAVRGATAEEKAVAAAQVQIAKAGVQEAASLRGETQLTAPRDGEIAKRMVNGGELAPLAFPIFTLVDLHEQWVTLNVREDQFHGLRMGQVLTGDVPALDRKGVRFKVDYISPQGDFATWRATRQSRGYDIRAFEVRARPVEPTAGLRPGMSVLFAWPQ
ncbi:MAG: efflux RND transporter periplasmic adaptor subunit [Clostridia bacterium]|nr:efflux RND transporter periplasmic adaptor subunit [Clostridia bacterium]